MQQGPIEATVQELRCRSCGAINPLGSTTCGSCGGTHLRETRPRRFRRRQPNASPVASSSAFLDGPATPLVRRAPGRLWMLLLSPVVWLVCLFADLIVLLALQRDIEADANADLFTLAFLVGLPLTVVVFAWAAQRRRRGRPFGTILAAGLAAINLAVVVAGFVVLPPVAPGP